MRSITVEQSRCNVPGDKSPPRPPFLSGAKLPSLHGLIEATTNFGLVASPDWGADCAETSMKRQAVNLAMSPPGGANQHPLSNCVNGGTCKWELSSQGHRCG